jgi:hypothetical protein
MAYILAIYETDRAYGGPEEGGWWYDCGQLVRIIATERTVTRANALAARANGLLARLQRGKRPIDSVAYSGGRHAVMVFERVAPAHFPSERPHYE